MRARLFSIGRRIVGGIATMVFISAVTFVLMNYQSGEEIARNVLGQEVAEVQLKAYAKEHGLDAPVHERYVTWVTNLAHGDLGTSLLTDSPVSKDLWPRAIRTLLLTVLSLGLAVPLSIALGIFAATRSGTLLDRVITFGTVFVNSIPEFVIGLGLLLLFAVEFRIFPIGPGPFTLGSFGQEVSAYVLPVATLAIGSVPHITRIARASVGDVLSAQYVSAAVLRGLPRQQVIWRHIMPNAAGPILNVIGLNLVFLLSGVVVIENVFGFPGIGQLLIAYAGTGDAVGVMALVFGMSAMFIGISLCIDILAAYFNPRLATAG